MTSVTSFLLLLISFQFIYIMNLIFTKNQIYQYDKSTKIENLNLLKSIKIVNKDITKDKHVINPGIACTDCSSDKDIVGVAATVLLYSPKWFQRRYTMMVENAINNIPSNWKVQIFYTGRAGSLSGININPGIQKHIAKGKVVLTLLPLELVNIKKLKKIQIMYSLWFWENMLADKVLLFGGSGVMCSNSLFSVKSFFQFDYIGIPWSSRQGVGGGGGMSLRNRNHMVQAINYALSKIKDPSQKEDLYKISGSEDHFFVSTLQDMNNKKLLNSTLASRDDTYRFGAVGGYSNNSVFVVSGTLPDVSFEERDSFLQYCPELKMVFPSLHDPNCFGASPKAAECAASICALKPKEIRKGGC